MSTRVLGWLGLLLFAACGGGGGEPADGAATSGDGGEPGLATPPAEPMGPSIDCPTGWHLITSAGTVQCDPWPSDGPSDCDPGWVHFPGTPGCERLGVACPSGPFREDLPADRPVVHVAPGATGGDGSRGSPYGSVTEFAVGGLARGTIITLARGRYDMEVRLPTGAGLWGACAEGTTVTSSIPAVEEAAVVNVVGSDVDIRDLCIAESPRSGLFVAGDGRGATLEAISIDDVEFVAFAFRRAVDIVASRISARGTRSRTADGMFGQGIIAQVGPNVTIDQASIVGSHYMGLWIDAPGTTVALRDVAVRDTRGRSLDGQSGRGFEIGFGATATIERAAIEGNHDVGIFSRDADSTVQLEDAVIRDTAAETLTGFGGSALGFQSGAALTATRTRIERNTGAGVFAALEGSRIDLRDALILDTRPAEVDPFFLGARSVNAQEGAAIGLERVVIDGAEQLGIYASDPGTTLMATDLTVSGIRDTPMGADAIRAQLGATVSLSRVHVRDSSSTGVIASDAELSIEDGRISTLQEEFAFGGRGLAVQLDGRITSRRVAITDIRGTGALAIAGGVLDAEDLAIQTIGISECPAGGCSNFAAGMAAVDDATISARRFTVDAVEVCGLLVSDTAQLDLMEGLVSGSVIGACVQSDGYDIDRLTSGVAYRDNDLNLDATTLPVPAPSGDAAGIATRP